MTGATLKTIFEGLIFLGVVLCSCKTPSSNRLQSDPSTENLNLKAPVFKQSGVTHFTAWDDSLVTYNAFSGEAELHIKLPQSGQYKQKSKLFQQPQLIDVRFSYHAQVVVAYSKDRVFVWQQRSGGVYRLVLQIPLVVTAVAVDKWGDYVAVAKQNPSEILIAKIPKSYQVLPDQLGFEIYGPELGTRDPNKMEYRDLIFLDRDSPDLTGKADPPIVLGAVDRTLVAVSEAGVGKLTFQDQQEGIDKILYVHHSSVGVVFAPPGTDATAVFKLVQIWPKWAPLFSKVYGHFDFNEITVKMDPASFMASPLALAPFKPQHTQDDPYAVSTGYFPPLFHLFSTNFNGNASVRLFHYFAASEEERRAERYSYKEAFAGDLFDQIGRIRVIQPHFVHKKLQALALTQTGEIYSWEWKDQIQ